MPAASFTSGFLSLAAETLARQNHWPGSEKDNPSLDHEVSLTLAFELSSVRLPHLIVIVQLLRTNSYCRATELLGRT